MPKKQLNKNFPIELINLSGGCQQRQLDPSTLDNYCKLMEDGVEFPPIEIINDGKNCWLWDGFHRVKCYQILGRKTTHANIMVGNKREAIWLSFSANRDHGLPRPPGAVKFILQQILKDDKWSKKTNSEIARHIGCSREYVRQIKEPNAPPEETTPEKPVSTVDKKPETTPKTPLKDREGHEIPQHLTERFLQGSVIEQRIRELQQLKNSVENSIMAGDLIYILLNQTAFEADIIRLIDRMKAAVPYALCPYCENKGCGTCCNSGFVNEIQWKNAPKNGGSKK